MRYLKIDKEFVRDPRFIKLTSQGYSFAYGEWLRATYLLTERMSRCVPRPIWDAEELCSSLIDVGLFAFIDDEVHFVPPSYCGAPGRVVKRMTPEDLVSIWNEHCGILSKVKEISGKRRSAARARLSECDDSVAWEKVVKWLAKSPWHTGKNSRGWKANFDFLVQPDTRVKVLERLDQISQTVSIGDL